MSMMSTPKAHLVVISSYQIHPEDMPLFIDIVRPHLQGTLEQPGCVHYSFSLDLLDNTRCHLAEGWVDQEAYLFHEKDPAFQLAFTQVMHTIRILDRQAIMYTVSGEAPIMPAIHESSTP